MLMIGFGTATDVCHCCSYRGRLINSAHITVNFCLALLLSMVFFFTIRAAVSSSAACTTVAAFLHFFMLSTFLWMMIEGMCMYRDLVIALGVDQRSKRFRNLAYAAAWGKYSQYKFLAPVFHFVVFFTQVCQLYWF